MRELQEGWLECFTKDGYVYYFNPFSNESMWEVRTYVRSFGRSKHFLYFLRLYVILSTAHFVHVCVFFGENLLFNDVVGKGIQTDWFDNL